MTAGGDLDRARIAELHARELMRYRQARPQSMAMIARARAHMPNGVPMAWMAYHADQLVYIDHGQGPGFTDIDGFSYVDFNASDLAMFCGHANPAIVAAVQAQAARSTQFLLPTVTSGAEAYALTDGQLTDLVRLWLANRGIWEALPGAGPTVPVPATRADVTRYVSAYAELLAELR